MDVENVRIQLQVGKELVDVPCNTNKYLIFPKKIIAKELEKYGRLSLYDGVYWRMPLTHKGVTRRRAQALVDFLKLYDEQMGKLPQAEVDAQERPGSEIPKWASDHFDAVNISVLTGANSAAIWLGDEKYQMYFSRYLGSPALRAKEEALSMARRASIGVSSAYEAQLTKWIASQQPHEESEDEDCC